MARNQQAAYQREAVELQHFAGSKGVLVNVTHVPTGGWELAFSNVDVVRAKTMMKAHATILDRAAQQPCFMNITIINSMGAPTTTQIMGRDGQAAIDCVRDYVRRGSDTTQTWYKPVIAAYVFDTYRKKLRTFSVDDHGVVTEL